MKNMLSYVFLGFLILVKGNFAFAQDSNAMPKLEWLKFVPTGEFVIDKNVKCGINQYGPGWKFQGQDKNSVEVKQSKNGCISGLFTTKTGDVFDFEQKVTKISNAEITYYARLKNPNGVETKLLCLALRAPIEHTGGAMIEVDGQKVSLPVEYKKMTILKKQSANKVSLMLSDGKLIVEGDLKVSIQDNRKFKRETCTIRLDFSQNTGQITDSSINARFLKKAYDVTPVDISAVANMGLKDKVTQDEKGGWTDQGASNDLSMLKPGKKVLAGVAFDIIDPAANNGKACVMMAGKARQYFAKSVELPLANQLGNYLYLLHALAWAPPHGTTVGDIIMTYDDGSKSTHPLKSGVDVGNWWAPRSRKNATVGWTGENDSSYVGLYITKLKLNGKPIKAISIQTAETGVWGIVAMSTSPDDIPCNKTSSPTYIVAGKEWKVFKQNKDIIPGSALDFSFLQDAPAGKYGHVVIRNGHYEFEHKKGDKIRFYGNNLFFSANYLTKKDCEKVADAFARIGYNSVRFHHHDRDLVEKGKDNSTTLDKAQLDKLDYLFYCFKKKGIYITTDLYVSRYLVANEIPEYPLAGRGYLKALVPLFQSARDNWKRFAKNMLNHKNPYTGMTWGEDPALFSFSLLNENTIYAYLKKYPDIRKIYDQRFDEWLKKNKLNPANGIERQKLMIKFITDLQIACEKELTAYVRELGCKALVSDVNWYSKTYQSLIRDQLDYVDNHDYWDHPKFMEKKYCFPIGYKNKSVISRGAKTPRRTMPTRIFGKPFMLTEFHYCFPNSYRAEGGPIMGAYASLQGWDGLYRFGYSANDIAIKKKESPISKYARFETIHDPVTMLSEKIGLLMFLRGDVKEAQKEVPFVFSDNYIENLTNTDGLYPVSYSYLGLTRKIGSVNLKNLNSGALKNVEMCVSDVAMDDGKVKLWSDELFKRYFSNDYLNMEKGIARSLDRQISLDEKNMTFKVVSAKTEALIVKDKKHLDGKVLSVDNEEEFAVFCLSSLDGLELEKSRHMLLFHLTDVQNNKIKFRGKNRTILERWGKLPLLQRKGRAKVSLALKGNYQVRALSLNGTPLADIPLTKTNQGLDVILDNIQNKQAMVYEIMAK